MVTNPDLIQKKRKLYLFYREIEDSFHKTYEYAMKVHTHESINALLVYLGIGLMNENSYVYGKKWLLKQEPIPSTVMGEKLSLRQRTSAKSRINRYELKRSYYEDIFFDCLTGKIIEKEQKQPVIETILIWLSYFYFLTEVFNININAYSTLIIIFIGLTIADISKHYVSYNMVVKHHVDMIDRFHQNLQEMYECMNEPDCQYIEIDGEMVPTSIKPGIRIKQIDF